jgi:3-deoxy-manno-octulosonate cytidylyltransferase (CMP-KDO synthetase)
MVERVRRSCVEAEVDRVIVATDDLRIARLVRAAGGEAVMTAAASSGTERVWLALQALDEPPALVVNVQGDLPLLPPMAVSTVVALLRSGSRLATLATPWPSEVPIGDPAVVKVAVNARGQATRFTRQAIRAWRHVGIYGFQYEALRLAIAADPAAARVENLEQVAWMEAGLSIDVAVISDAGPSVDTPEQLGIVRQQVLDPMYPEPAPRVTSGPEVVE